MENYSEICINEKNLSNCEKKYLCVNCIFNNTSVKDKCDYGDIGTEVFQDEITKVIKNFQNIEVIDGPLPSEYSLKFELYDYLDKGENFKSDVEDAAKLIKEMTDLTVKYEFNQHEFWNGWEMLPSNIYCTLTIGEEEEKEEKEEKEKGFDNVVQIKWEIKALEYALRTTWLNAYNATTARLNDHSGKKYLSDEDVKKIKEIEQFCVKNYPLMEKLYNKISAMQHEDE